MSETDDAETRIRELEREVRELRERLRLAEVHKTEALTRLAGGFSHDINNFLTPMLAYSGMIKDEVPQGHLAAEYAQEIFDAAEKTQQFIKLMQDIRAKGQFGGIFSPNEAVQLAVADVQPRLNGAIQLIANLAPDMPQAVGDVAAMRRALRELLENSVNSMPVGGDLTVTTKTAKLDAEMPMDGATAPAGDYAMITVRDQGTGMSDDTMARKYEPYFTTRPRGQAKGLGLSIAIGLVVKCGGYIRCESAFGSGTTFEIFLRAHTPVPLGEAEASP